MQDYFIDAFIRKKLFCLVIVTAFCGHNVFGANLIQYVNPFIGTVVGSGNTYPGAQVPFGMISWSPQSADFGWNPGGYSYQNGQINGFGLIHLSGAGCSATCELPFTPCTGELNASPATNKNVYSSDFSHTNEFAAPGFYSIKLATWNIDFENTVRARSGIAHIDFPKTDKANLILNPNAAGAGLYDGAIFIDAINQTISGWAKSGSFCGIQGCDYTVYFAAKFDRPFANFGTWKNDQKFVGANSVSGKGLASYVTFDCTKKTRVTMKVGISFVSIANAKLNLDTEIPDWNFAAVKSAASKEWNRCLNRIQVSGGSREDTTIFYTALYHALMLPSIFEDVNGQYIGMDNQIHTVAPGHHFLATFSGWDTYRTQAQLWGLLFPDAASDFCSSFLAMSQQTQKNGGGGLPLWSMFNDETLVMAGYPADPYIANAYAFGATNFDLAALKKVMVDSGKNQRWCGRGLNFTWDHLPEYEKFGYYPAELTDYSVSKNVEYSVADFAIAQICKVTGDDANYNYFFKRSQNVFNSFNPATGYLQRKNQDGKFVAPFDKFSGDGFMEGNAVQYTWTTPHNLYRLIQLLGGNERAEAKLDELTANLATGYSYQSKFYDAGNEPCFGIMPVYNWLQKPWKAQEKIRMVMLNCFSNAPAGIPGDDDSGAMSAWYVFTALGLYPEIPGVGGVTILSPLFPKVVLNLPNGNKITITAKNASRDAKYIQSLTVNGKSSSNLWLTLDELKNNSRKNSSLKFIMGKTPNKNWGTAKEDAPPSFEPSQFQADKTNSSFLATRRLTTDSEHPFLHPLFCDHAVLQRDVSVPVWGWSVPGSKVVVSFADQNLTAIADANGKWMVKLKPLRASTEPRVLSTTNLTTHESAVANDVLIGDVWLCSGQSNMEMGMMLCNTTNDIATANFPLIHLLTVPKHTALSPEDTLQCHWQPCSPDAVMKEGTWDGFSAAAFYFGRELNHELKIPIGLIQDSWGGTVAEAWTSAEGLAPLGDFNQALAQVRNMADDKYATNYLQSYENWCRQKDFGTQQSWATMLNADANWKSVQMPQPFEQIGLAQFDGMVWFRYEFNVPTDWSGKDLKLDLGQVDDMDTTWINGVKVGQMNRFDAFRTYAVPANIVKPGKNIITVRVLDTGGYGGFMAKTDQFHIAPVNSQTKTSISLAGVWQMRVSTPLSQLGTPPLPPDSGNPNITTVLYNGMIAPLLPFAIKGAIWYQGESNADHLDRAKQYRRLLPALIGDWRGHFAIGNFPFYIVQLAGFNPTNAGSSDVNWAELREAQSLTAESVPDCGLAVAIDIGDTDNIHPKNKHEVGRRLALNALAKTYGEKIEYSGPWYRSMKVDGNKIRLRFDHAEGGLKTDDSILNGFEIAGKDRGFVRAEAIIEGRTVIVSSPVVPKPVAVCYGWNSTLICNLYNQAGLPAVPFNTDN
ncbi:MAG TPA: GH92 family glycosyl hydrolase [Verrucomicrobiae bacterium]|nr:GH92 family glycosyl hydrolase [Verrucomicrobiae bacterium]